MRINDEKAMIGSVNMNVILTLNNPDMTSIGWESIGSFFRKGNLIVTTSCAFESTNRFIAQVFANDQINVEVFMRN